MAGEVKQRWVRALLAWVVVGAAMGAAGFNVLPVWYMLNEPESIPADWWGIVLICVPVGLAIGAVGSFIGGLLGLGIMRLAAPHKLVLGVSIGAIVGLIAAALFAFWLSQFGVGISGTGVS